MKVDVYDTWATGADGGTIHFDVLLESNKHEDAAGTAYRWAKDYLASINASDAKLEQRECAFCHQENARPNVAADVERQGYHIIPMEGCPR